MATGAQNMRGEEFMGWVRGERRREEREKKRGKREGERKEREDGRRERMGGEREGEREGGDKWWVEIYEEGRKEGLR